MLERRIYLDNAATSFPKAPGLGDVTAQYLDKECVNLNRTESRFSIKTFNFIHSLRERLCGVYGYSHPECVIFTRGATESLNWLIKGLLKPSDHVIVTSLEHNAVMRPLVQMNIRFSRIPCDAYGYCGPEDAERLIQPDTRAMIINAVSNVFGSIQDVEVLSEVARRHGLLLFIDCAQASPYVKINMEKLNAAAVVFAGHKGFLGPQGTGGFILRRELSERLEPLISGGTGSMSDSEDIPSMLPDRFTPGTENLPGLRGLAHSVDYVLETLPVLRENVRKNTTLLYEGLADIPQIEIKGPDLEMPRTGVVSVTSEKADVADIAAFLSENGIETRVGMHCSPSAHKAMGTFPRGTLRFSPGPFTTAGEIEETLECIKCFFSSKK